MRGAQQLWSKRYLAREVAELVCHAISSMLLPDEFFQGIRVVLQTQVWKSCQWIYKNISIASSLWNFKTCYENYLTIYIFSGRIYTTPEEKFVSILAPMQDTAAWTWLLHSSWCWWWYNSLNPCWCWWTHGIIRLWEFECSMHEFCPEKTEWAIYLCKVCK